MAKEEKPTKKEKPTSGKPQIPSDEDMARRAVATVTADPLPAATPKKEVKSEMEERRALLEARVKGAARGRNDYPPETVRGWKRELVLMDKGLWHGKVKLKSKNKLVDEIIG